MSLQTLLALDPGLRGIGIAYFEGGTLRYANYLPNSAEGEGPIAWFGMADVLYQDLKMRSMRVDRYVCEFPQVYRVSKGDPNDLIQITAVAAACGAVLPIQECVGYRPREWKGQIKKERHHPMILKRLDSGESRAILEKRKTYVHNVIDAIGIGLYDLDRRGLR